MSTDRFPFGPPHGAGEGPGLHRKMALSVMVHLLLERLDAEIEDELEDALPDCANCDDQSCPQWWAAHSDQEGGEWHRN